MEKKAKGVFTNFTDDNLVDVKISYNYIEGLVTVYAVGNDDKIIILAQEEIDRLNEQPEKIVRSKEDMEKKELERLERIEEKLDILFDLIKGKLTTGVYTSGNTDRITLPVTTTEEEEKNIENWEREWEITPVYNQISFIKALLDKAREEGFDSGVEKTVNIIQEGLDELLLEKDGEKYWVGDILRDCGSSVEKILPQNMKHYLLSKLKQ